MIPPIEVHDLTLAYDVKPVLWDIDFDLAESRLLAVIGPNGAGKSSLIKAIMGLIQPASGQVLIYGKPLGKQRKKIAYVPQRESVDWDFPISVLDLVLMGRFSHLKLFRRPGKQDYRIAEESLEKVDMLAFAKRQISQLSGGQQQRVFLARALAQEAEIYLMDEPFSGVDAATETVI
ncbi:MAG: ABC transporter ATP-binding protein, partial [Balneolales bacterium]